MTDPAQSPVDISPAAVAAEIAYLRIAVHISATTCRRFADLIEALAADRDALRSQRDEWQAISLSLREVSGAERPVGQSATERPSDLDAITWLMD